MLLNSNLLKKIAKFLTNNILSSEVTILDFHKKALADYKIIDSWPEDVLKEAKISNDNFQKKEDSLEDLPFVTIDGEDAKDFDDAIHCSMTESGFTLRVAIADVSFYVKPNSALDKEARKRTTSVYLPKKVIPMLPEKLSNELCSLQPNKRRRCLCVNISFDKNGHIEEYTFQRGIIRSAARLTYNQVEEFINSGIENVVYENSLKSSFFLFEKLLKNRKSRGALDFEISEPFVSTDKQAKVKKVQARKRLKAHKLIEEFMLCANISAADFLSKYAKEGIFRIHDYPESLKIDRLSQVLKNRAINWNGSVEDVDNLSFFIEKICKREDSSILNTLVLQAMQRAEYSTLNKGHFGLKFPKYTHFTSPIRRYPDLLVHRTIIGILTKQEYNDSALQQILEECSEKEKLAEYASKQVVQNLICQHVKQFIGKSFSGFITGVKDFGLFIEIPELFTSGLLHVNDLPNDFYRYNARHHTLQGRKRGNKFSLGSQIDVYIGDVKELEGKISLYY